MSHSKSIIYLIPSLLDDEAIDTIPRYIIDAVEDCQVFFVENERTARRYLKQLWKVYLPEQEIVITATEKDDGVLELVAQQEDRQIVKNAEAKLSS